MIGSQRCNLFTNRTIFGSKAPAKRSQHANKTYRNIVGRNMLRAFGHLVAMCCDMSGVVGSNLTSFKLEPTTRNMSQQGGQTRTTCCAQQCWDMLRLMLRSFGRGLTVIHRFQSRDSPSFPILPFIGNQGDGVRII